MNAQEQIKTKVGIIGGSGLYEIPGLKNARWRKVETPFGNPSDDLLEGELDGTALVFLPRHGRGHPIPPSEINFAANIAALKMSGVTDVISVSAVGSLAEDLAPGAFVVIDQFIDRTLGRPRSFFGKGLVAHVGLADPVCARLGDDLEAVLKDLKHPHQRGGAYVVIEGPQFSTRAESELFRTWGARVIGMTNLPEARFAREAELCYATLAMVTDFDCWHPGHDAVTVEQIVKVLLKNAEDAKAVIAGLARRLGQRAVPCAYGCDRALDHAIITQGAARDPDLVARLHSVAARVLGEG